MFSHRSRIFLLRIKSGLAHAVHILAVLLKLLHLLLAVGLENIFEFLIHAFCVKLPFEVLSFRLRHLLVLVHLFVDLPFVTTGFDVDFVSLFLIAPVIVNELEKFCLFLVALFLLLHGQITQIHFSGRLRLCCCHILNFYYLNSRIF